MSPARSGKTWCGKDAAIVLRGWISVLIVCWKERSAFAMAWFGCIEMILEVESWSKGRWGGFVWASGDSVRGMWECEAICREPKSLWAAGFGAGGAGAVLVEAVPSVVPGAAIRCQDCPTLQVRVPARVSLLGHPVLALTEWERGFTSCCKFLVLS